MKSLIAIVFLAFPNIVRAACPLVDAQVLAQVQDIKSEDDTTCTITLQFSSSRAQLNPNYACPLEVGDISTGITIQKMGSSCPVTPGQFVSGVLYKSTTSADSRVFLNLF